MSILAPAYTNTDYGFLSLSMRWKHPCLPQLYTSVRAPHSGSNPKQALRCEPNESEPIVNSRKLKEHSREKGRWFSMLLMGDRASRPARLFCEGWVGVLTESSPPGAHRRHSSQHKAILTWNTIVFQMKMRPDYDHIQCLLELRCCHRLWYRLVVLEDC